MSQNNSTEEFEKALKERQNRHYVLRLFVSGATSRSMKAIEIIRKICEEYLGGQYELEVIDIHQQPERAKSEQIIAVPTLLKKLPAPLRVFIGDLSDRERILVGLDIKEKERKNASR